MQICGDVSFKILHITLCGICPTTLIKKTTMRWWCLWMKIILYGHHVSHFTAIMLHRSTIWCLKRYSLSLRSFSCKNYRNRKSASQDTIKITKRMLVCCLSTCTEFYHRPWMRGIVCDTYKQRRSRSFCISCAWVHVGWDRKRKKNMQNRTWLLILVYFLVLWHGMHVHVLLVS